MTEQPDDDTTNEAPIYYQKRAILPVLLICLGILVYAGLTAGTTTVSFAAIVLGFLLMLVGTFRSLSAPDSMDDDSDYREKMVE
ncbi:hypothetical protein ZOD2009_13816 [Haladaptatus paucihalophilus DX253]|uniref:Uncharacterized protein n=1 Tax=Haladaptatus paucihalophilus DX253 TaxID=797209 RepID=E7QVC7_HALPU|nr:MULTISPECIES: hypothetical protein [Haladaptatus]EFW91449.1 hypothetical protein ZOD2009_13816 [Haladaptatus paucihalophilus DX253]GKZ15475.1 hypothetical protein HAL_33560 [Haladaptatus sp. T7]